MTVHLISGPRNLSTALMYFFAHRGDFKVVDEPFYGYYLANTSVDHPGRNETLDSMETDQDLIIAQLDALRKEHRNIFLKDMAHHLIMEDVNFLFRDQHIFLIRDPKQLITSYAKVIAEPTMKDIGLDRELELFELLHETNPIVIDSGELLKKPDHVLKTMCEKLGIPFAASMLQWPKGPIPEDGVWAEYWYKTVHQSTGFSEQKTSNVPLSDHCLRLYEDSLPYYKQLYSQAIKAE